MGKVALSRHSHQNAYYHKGNFEGISGDLKKKTEFFFFCAVLSKSLTAEASVRDNWKLLSKILPSLSYWNAQERFVFEWYTLEILSIAINKIVLAVYKKSHSSSSESKSDISENGWETTEGVQMRYHGNSMNLFLGQWNSEDQGLRHQKDGGSHLHPTTSYPNNSGEFTEPLWAPVSSSVKKYNVDTY